MLDASAGVEIALWTDVGSRLARHVITAEEIVVPDHFYVEGAAALRRMELRSVLTPEEAWTAVEQLLTLRVTSSETAPLLGEAWAMRHNVTIGDGLYVAIAQRLGVALVTGDARLARAPNLGIEILDASTPPTS